MDNAPTYLALLASAVVVLLIVGMAASARSLRNRHDREKHPKLGETDLDANNTATQFMLYGPCAAVFAVSVLAGAALIVQANTSPWLQGMLQGMFSLVGGLFLLGSLVPVALAIFFGRRLEQAIRQEKSQRLSPGH